MSTMSRGDLIGASLGAFLVGALTFTVFAFAGLTSIGYQVVAVAAGFATMAYFLSRHSDETRTHRQ